MADQREWFKGESSRGYNYTYCEGEHVSLTELKNDNKFLKTSNNGYLRNKNIPDYPEYVFSGSEVCHVTDKRGLEGIFSDGGFKANGSFLWWSLSVPDYYLSKETTSPAFQDESRYGNFRFTLPLRELLNLYRKQYRDSNAPVLRVLDTQVYKQEILYSILVHPRYMRHYRKYPNLPFDDESVCGYRKGSWFWRCQSPSNKYFVWDHVGVAFHMKPGQILNVDPDRLADSLSACEVASKNLLREPKRAITLPEAEKIVDYYK
ncbi:uncharacterized protein LOC128513947 [Clarias gariepinus]|uniref:uncharacterized protein LOC128513947 n=1 Tax=Clarias gariepinus TaxID=13013 RepID=UPI00234C7A41|nr:uncharacterized protein LOC128513947 [Clarias gariepinus]XP_053343499.1 uncharacterized protein LOC128513947 [Clarias gariepinus]